jgi:hypothetical protein
METITEPPKDMPAFCIEQFTLLAEEIKGLKRTNQFIVALLSANLAAIVGAIITVVATR